MIRINIEQGSQEWHEARYRKIGGTASKGLFVDSETLVLELLGKFLEDFEEVDGFISADMERGNELEPYAVKELNKYTGLIFNSVGWLQSEVNSLIGISPDGITDNDEASCEIKCPGRKKHTETILKNEIPKDNINQCLHYFIVNPKLKRHFFASFRPENNIKPLFVKELTRESIIDLGWKKKIEVEVLGAKGTPIKPKIVSVPDLKTINEWVEIAYKKAAEIQTQKNEAIKQLEF